MIYSEVDEIFTLRRGESVLCNAYQTHPILTNPTKEAIAGTIVEERGRVVYERARETNEHYEHFRGAK